jgi:hypothetical protein
MARGKSIGFLSLAHLCFASGPIDLVAPLFPTFAGGKEMQFTRVQNRNISLLFQNHLFVSENNETVLYCNMCGHVFF